MSKTTKAESLAHSIATTIWNDFIARPYNAGTPYNFSFKQLKQVIQKEVVNSRQSEIDELKAEIEMLSNQVSSLVNSLEKSRNEIIIYKNEVRINQQNK